MKVVCTEAMNYKLSHNIALQGTYVKDGSGKAIALKSAQDSYLASALNKQNQP